jgi:tetratricopeptide (TPR) repeat protein
VPLKPAAICCALIVFSAIALAQKSPVVPARPTVGTTTPTTNNSVPTNTNTSTNNPNINPIARPIYLSGKVVLQDGTPPPALVKIERVCGGSPRAQGYTDAKGHFQFQVDSPTSAGDEDASEARSSGGLIARPSAASRGMLAGCELRASLPGFFSSSISLSNRTEFDNPDVGIIILKRAGSVEGTTISMTSLNAPKDALKAYEKGRELMKKEKTDEAERSFQKAVEIYPKYATAWYQLGLLQTRNQLDQAEVSFTKSIEADNKFISPYLSLSLLLERSKRWQQALDLSDTVIKMNPADFPQAHFFKAAAHYNLHDDVDAEKSARKTIELDIRHEFPQAEKLLGVILSQHNDLAGGTEHLRKYLEMMPKASDADQVRGIIANNEKQSVAAKEP